MGGLDFSGLAQQSAADSATEPRRIFASLPAKHAKYSYARDVQSDVWSAWHKRRTDRDLVIKMNTGGGKTVVGLMVLKACLNEGVGPAGYFTPDNYLANQVLTEAAALGIETTTDPDAAGFRRGHAILVATVHKLFNGRSVFGIRGGAREVLDLGAVLIDDAHACLATIEEQFTLRVPATHAVYAPLVELFEKDLAAQSSPTLRDIRSGEFSAVLPIPYWAWNAKHEQVLELLHPHRDDDRLKFSWPLLADLLPLCRVGVSSTGIEVRPPCPPVEMVPSFERAERRIYMTATLADDSILVTDFAADAESVARPVTPSTANDLGDRMILTPLQTWPSLSEEELRDFAVEQAQRYNVVVIVPSRARASFWQDVARNVLLADGLHEGLAPLRREEHVGLVVLVNKYDGIDLPGKACQVLILDGLPEAQGVIERLDSAALDGSEALLTRQVQRIEQGMGRGVRSNDDYCAVMLVGKRLTSRLFGPAARKRFSPATLAQLELSDKISALLEAKGFEELGPVIDQCLTRDTSWVTASRAALDTVSFPERAEISPRAIAQREAFALAQDRRFADAAARLDAPIAATTDRQLRGLIKQQAAAYLHHVDPVGAQKLQLSAHSDNRALIKPRQGISYARLVAGADQAQTASAFLAESYAKPQELILGFEALVEALTPSPDESAVPRFEQALADLAKHLGLGAQRPERDIGKGPDVLWSLGGLEFLVIECKSGATTATIAKSDAAQLSHSVDWFEGSYDTSCSATPVLVHPSRVLDERASARESARVMTFEKLAEWREAVRSFAVSVSTDRAYRDPRAVNQRLQDVGLNGPAFVPRWTVTPRAS